MGIVDNLLIQADPLDETDSLLVSSPRYSRGDERSPLPKNEYLRPLLFCGISALVFMGRCCGVVAGRGFGELAGGTGGLLSGVMTVELVPGRVFGDDVP